MEEMLFLCHQVIHDPLSVKGDHILIQLHSVREELSPVKICLPVIVNEHRRIDPAAGKLYRIFKRPLRAVGYRHSLAVILHAEIEIIFSVLLDTVRHKQKGRLFLFFLLLKLFFRYTGFHRTSHVPHCPECDTPEGGLDFFCL